jgi:hypothetical protein
MLVNEDGVLDASEKQSHWAVKAAAHFFSYLFHPLLITGWIAAYFLYVHPTVFLGLDSFDKFKVLMRVFSTGIFLPIITVLLLKGLGFIDSIQLKTQKERIIPYVACITFFFWSYYVSKKLGDPKELKAFLLALFIISSVALVINNFMKISMHAMGAGGMVTLFSLLLFNYNIDNALILAGVLLIAGITCTSRLVVSDHKSSEIIAGFVTGMVIQLITWQII